MATRHVVGVLIVAMTSVGLIVVGCEDETETPTPTGTTTSGTTTTGTPSGSTPSGTASGSTPTGQGGSGGQGGGQGGQAGQGGNTFVWECGSGQGGGGGHAGGGQGGGCITCSEWLDGADPTTICNSSCAVADPLATCACIDECAGPCGANFCQGIAPSGGCTNCRTGHCEDEVNACAADN